MKDAKASATFEGMYGTSTDTVLNGTGKETFEAIRIVPGHTETSLLAR